MMRRLQLGWLMVVGGAVLAFPACSDDDDNMMNSGGSASQAGSGNAGEPAAGGAAASDGTDECKVMGELCHEADTGSGPAHECHETGHAGDGKVCLEEFAGCINTCVSEAPANLSLEDARCSALGELCHPVDDKDGPLHACHELGHDNDGPKCAAQFNDCATRCLAARDAAEGSGEGGAGGAAAAGGAGGATAAGGTAGNGG